MAATLIRNNEGEYFKIDDDDDDDDEENGTCELL